MRHVNRIVTAAVAGLLLAGHAMAGDVTLSSEVVVEGLILPVYVTAPDRDERLFVLEQISGHVKLVKDGVIEPEPFLDLGSELTIGGERGLLCLAFHPDYDVNGRFYVTYNGAGGDLVLARFLVDPLDPDRALPGSREIIMSLPQPFPQHNGSMITFGDDGLFYMSTGDGGSGGDPFDNAQNLSSLLGKLLRIDVDGAFPYTIPPNNPFIGVPGAREEVLAYGLRNPWRFSLDAQSGLAIIGDVGQNLIEEVSVMRTDVGGANFGWRCAEGTLCTGLGTCSCPEPDVVDPIHEYSHDDGCAIVGGYVYRGDAIAGLRGDYLFADYCTDRVWSFRPTPNGPIGFTERTFELSPPGGAFGFITSFGLDGFGELLIVAYEGVVYRVTEAPPIPDCDGDGISDEDEIAGGTAFDANANGLPDDCEVLLVGTPLIEDQLATLDFVGAAPNQPLAWFASLRGIGFGPCYFGGSLCLDLLPHLLVPGQPPGVYLLTISAADAQGAGSLSFVVPDVSMIPSPIAAFQVVAADGLESVKSNPIQKTLQGP